jgi:hypothetical protein
VALDAELGGGAQQSEALVAKAHAICPYSKATRGNIDVKLLANGNAVGSSCWRGRRWRNVLLCLKAERPQDAWFSGRAASCRAVGRDSRGGRSGAVSGVGRICDRRDPARRRRRPCGALETTNDYWLGGDVAAASSFSLAQARCS